jgi:hypothetical protein
VFFCAAGIPVLPLSFILDAALAKGAGDVLGRKLLGGPKRQPQDSALVDFRFTRTGSYPAPKPRKDFEMGKETSATDRRHKGKYNGHPSWTLWNVSMWMANDYGLYTYMMELCQRHGKQRAADILFDEIGGTTTPDGARFSRSSIRYGLRHL